MRVTNPLLPKPLVQRPDHPAPHEAWSLPEVRRSPSAWAAAPSAWATARSAWAAEPPGDTSATTRATHPQPPGPPLEGSLQMLEGQQLAAGGEDHADRVASDRRRRRPAGPLAHPACHHPPHLPALGGVDGLKRRHRPPAPPARLDLAEGQGVPVEGDDVQFAPARPVVALEDL